MLRWVSHFPLAEINVTTQLIKMCAILKSEQNQVSLFHQLPRHRRGLACDTMFTMFAPTLLVRLLVGWFLNGLSCDWTRFRPRHVAIVAIGEAGPLLPILKSDH